MTFHNIFSNEKKTTSNTKPKQKIIIDYREKNSLVPSELIKLGFEIKFKQLKVADYIIKDIAIERKTINDFTSSIINKRLKKQLEELQQYRRKLLIIEHYQNFQENTNIHPNCIKGFILSTTLKYNVPIIFTKNEKETAQYIYLLSKKKEKESPINIRKKNLNSKEQLQFIIESFPDIGPKTTKKLLKEFKTIKNIINAKEEKLKKILGKKTGKFTQIINRKY